MLRRTTTNHIGSGFRRQPLLLSTAIAALLCAAGMRPASAQSVTGSGDLNPRPAQSPNWAVGSDLTVGDTGIGQLNITAGGTVTNDLGYIGYDLTGQGTVTVSGIGSSGASTWTNTGDLYVGYNGTGTLNILAGGRVSNVGGNLGADTTGLGTALVSGNGSSWQNSGQLFIGSRGAGFLRVEGGATVSSTDGIVGGNAAGDVTLTGPGTRWTNTVQLTVGSYAVGTLRIENGASVTSNQGYIGANSTGTVTVTGVGSSWTMAPYDLTIGNDGTGTLVVDGGLVRAQAGVRMGMSSGANANLTLVDIGGSRGVLETRQVLGGAGTAVFTFDGGLLRATSNNATFFRGFDTRTIHITGNGGVIDTDGHDIGISPTFTGAGELIKDGAGKLELTGNSGATFTGAASVIGGTLAVNGVLGGTMEVISGRLQGIGTVGATINQPGGTIAPGNSIGTLTINGNYVGNGGRLDIETVLGGDASPSDRLVITGSTAGSTLVTVLNQGGAGAPTVEGIKVVDVAGASNGVFTLQGNTVFQGQQAVVAGAYAYSLQKNGISTPNDGDWYLRSAYMAPPTPTSPSTGPTVIGPIYQPGAPLYEAYGQVLQSLNELQTLRQRVGERLDGRTGETPNAAGRAIWARIDAAHSRVTPGFSTTGTNYMIDSWRLQAGADGQVFADDAGTLVGGVSLHHGEALADIASVFGRGRIKASGTGFGGALTWYGASGFYADAQTKLSWFDSDLSSTTTGRQLAKGRGGFGYALGLELGQRIALSDSWSLTPQAQLTYSHVDADSFVDPFGARVTLTDGDSLRGRLGISADYRQSWRDDAGRQVNASLYGIANLRYEFLDGTTANLAGTLLTSREKRLWGGLGLGAKYETGRYALYGEVEAQTSLAQFGDSHSITGRGGLRIRW